MPVPTGDKDSTVAMLMQYVVHAMKMNHGPDNSSTAPTDAMVALINYLGYDKNCRIVGRSQYTISQWDSLIYGELANKRPIYYGGDAYNYGSFASHAFVCDGYDGAGLYHFNWGWEGSFNGYYKLSVLNLHTSTFNNSIRFTLDQIALIGIQKPTGDSVLSEVPQLNTGNFYLSGPNTVHADYMNDTAIADSFYYGLGYRNSKGVITEIYYLVVP